MSLPAVIQHLQVLEGSGLVTSKKVGRVRSCRVEPAAFHAAETWFDERKSTWERRLDRLGALLDEPEPAQKPRRKS
jgi:DNA-binding transcriptional ArsR family regulator